MCSGCFLPSPTCIMLCVCVWSASKLLLRFSRHYVPDLVQVLPELHLARIRAQLVEVCAQKHLSVYDLGTVLVEGLANLPALRGVLGREGSRGDVVLKKLAVDDVDDGRDQGFDVFCARDERFNVVCVRGQCDAIPLCV